MGSDNIRYIDEEAERRKFEIVRIMLPIVWHETGEPSIRGKVHDAVARAVEIADMVEQKLKGGAK